MFTHPRLPHNRRCCSCAFVTRLDSRYASARAMNKHLLLFVHTFDTKVSPRCLLATEASSVFMMHVYLVVFHVNVETHLNVFVT